MALHTEVGKRFIKLVKVKDYWDKEYVQEFINYDGGYDDTALIDNYTVDYNENYGYRSVIDIDELNAKLVDVTWDDSIFLYGDEYDRRCWGNRIQVYILENGDVYMDMALEDMAFA